MKLRAQLFVLFSLILFGLLAVPADADAQAPTIKRDSVNRKRRFKKATSFIRSEITATP
jgi:hypothetical protein